MTVLYRNLLVPFHRPEVRFEGLTHKERDLPEEHQRRLAGLVSKRLHIPSQAIRKVVLLKKSLDSRRGRRPRYSLTLALDLDAELEAQLLARKRPLVARHAPVLPESLPRVSRQQRPIVVGAGPAGLFCAWRLAQAGARPVLLERGPEVTERSKRWSQFLRGGEFDPQCNLLFGEGGAGAYSDGKLYTRVKDRRNNEVLEALVAAGAPAEILYDAKPHIGSNLLPSVVRRFRKHLEGLGVEFRFDVEVKELHRDGDLTRGVVTADGTVIEGSAVFLALGHSARDTLRNLVRQGIPVEPKPFQLGVRVEHPQSVIDEIQYGEEAGHEALPPAEYQWVAKSHFREEPHDVFSFCMCPGGEILPSTEKAGFFCSNGASKYRRQSPFANSGFVITLEPEQLKPWGDRAPTDPERVLAGLYFQEQVESDAAKSAAIPFAAPALRLTDFIEGRVSADLPVSSYPQQFPLVPVAFEKFLPDFVLEPIRSGLAELCRRFPQLYSDMAIVVAPESRSSSPVRFVRDPETLECGEGLYPIGEGAGYAGGIMSAAIDGMRAAEAWAKSRASDTSGSIADGMRK